MAIIELTNQLNNLSNQKDQLAKVIKETKEDRDNLLEQVKAFETYIKGYEGELWNIVQQSTKIEAQIEEINGLVYQLKTVDPAMLKMALIELGVITSPNDGPNDGPIQYLSIDSINVDPKRFQFKIVGSMNATGSVGSLSGCQIWDDNLAGILSVWQDDNGKIWVVNGHNRLDKAKKLGVKSLLVRFIKADNALEARSIGALINIAEGQGTAIDVAKFLRDTGKKSTYLLESGINLKSKLAKEGLALSKLESSLFGLVLNNTIPIKQGVAIGQSDLSESQQIELWKMIKGKNISTNAISDLVDLIKFSPQFNDSLSLLDLIGYDNNQQSLALIKADIQSTIKANLRKNKRLFDTVANSFNSNTLEGTGAAIIDRDRSSINSEKIEEIMLAFEINKNGNTSLSKLLDRAAMDIKNGTAKSKAIKKTVDP